MSEWWKMPHRYTNAQRVRDWQFVYATPEGRRAISQLFVDCCLFRSTHDPDPHIAAFNEGRRAVALDIVSALEISPTAYRDVTEAIKELNE